MIDDFLQKSEPLQLLYSSLRGGHSILIEQLWNSPKALLAAIAHRATGKNILILTGESQEEARLYHDFSLFTEAEVIDFPAWETLPGEQIAPSPDIVGERYSVLSTALHSKEPLIVLSGLQACLQKVIPEEDFKALYLSLKVGDQISFDKLIHQLEAMGYHRSSIASDKGEFAQRGNIVDIFPVTSPDPHRIEFWGDEVESIRLYDPIGQKSVRKANAISVTPAQEFELIKKRGRLSTLLDYLGNNTLVIFDDLLALEDRYANLVGICPTPIHSFNTIDRLFETIARAQKIFWPQSPIEELSSIKQLTPPKGSYYSKNNLLQEIEFELFNRPFRASRWQHDFTSLSEYLMPYQENDSGEELLRALSRLSKSYVELTFLSASAVEEEALKKKISEGEVALPKAHHFRRGYLSEGIASPSLAMILFPATEIRKRYKIRRPKMRSTYHTAPSEVFDLLPGELVVHYQHGIGRYVGVENKKAVSGAVEEFLAIEYANNSKMFVPMNQAYLVSRYIGASESQPILNTIGSSRWKSTREKTQAAIFNYAQDLLALYAQRSISRGIAYSPDSPEMLAFEEEFPYMETEDQLSAIADVKADMMKAKCMDRLICGDVGYGKTEVAMRAAVKAVLDGGRQVAVLVPTTVLAMQHYETFIERMAGFPINIAVLSRFRTQKQLKATLSGIADGTVDIAIGTHRLISGDVNFKELGLVIIDEEQRFGVKAKELLKQAKSGVDCLTLSATPIPRTLYLSLSGARDLSVINTPPQDRLPITTIIGEKSLTLFKTALQRELARDGQAFIIHNRVETIYEIADQVKQLLPQAKVAICHGKMSSEEIDTVFHAFKNGSAEILVATSIVESGIDIPNANTILIDRADIFGLSDLYQLRGRVGRWNRRAYAYFLVRNIEKMAEVTRKRLAALAEASGYGGGMKLAMRDLEIRGAGNILGYQQSGQVAAVGFHLYCKMLKRTIALLQKGETPTIIDTKIDFNIDARLTEEYINSTSLRIEIYKRFGEAISLEEVDAIWAELRDRFGPPPRPSQWLYHLTRVKVHASKLSIIALKLEKSLLTVEQKVGNKTALKKLPFSLPQNPEEMESRLLRVLTP